MKAKELIALLATDPEAEVLICSDTLKFDSIGLALWQREQFLDFSTHNF